MRRSTIKDTSSYYIQATRTTKQKVGGSTRVIFVGLLSDQQKRASYFVTQDEDFIWLWYGKNTNSPYCIGIFLYLDAKVREIREYCQAHLEGRLYEDTRVQQKVA